MNHDLDYYQQNYPNYNLQNPERKMNYYRSLVELGLQPPRSTPRLLDLGCAFGRFLGHVRQGYAVYGQEMNGAALEIAASTIPEGHFRCQALPEIAFSEVFDVIVAFDVLEHVPDLTGVLESIKARLSKDGCFVFVVPVYDGLTGPIIRLLDKDPTHVHKESRWFWLDWVSKEFQVVSWQGIYRYLLFSYYLHLPTVRFRTMTPALAVVARPKSDS